MKKQIITLLAFFWLAEPAMAGLLFTYNQLQLKDLEQMQKIIDNKVRESEKEAAGKMVPLKEALQAVYARPDDDDMIDKLIGTLRNKLDELESWEKSISQLTDEAINALKNPKAFKPTVQVTYQIFLENLLSEMKPYVDQVGFEKKIAERIRDAKIQPTKEAVSERSLRLMKETTSPSEIARNILDKAEEASKKKAAQDSSSK